jgi:hypothetical protein
MPPDTMEPCDKRSKGRIAEYSCVPIRLVAYVVAFQSSEVDVVVHTMRKHQDP